MTKTTDPMDAVFAALRAALAEKQKGRLTIITQLRNLLDRYEKAGTAGDLKKVMTDLGLNTPDGEDPATLALEIISVSQTLPEFAGDVPAVAATESAKEEVAPTKSTPKAVAAPVELDHVRVTDSRAGKLDIPKVSPYPLLSAAAPYGGDKPIVTVGGLYLLDRDRWVKQLGIAHEWLDTTNSGNVEARIDALCVRIVEGKVAAVIILNELIGHKLSKQVVDACKKGKIPMGTAKKGQQGTMKLALDYFEGELKA